MRRLLWMGMALLWAVPLGAEAPIGVKLSASVVGAGSSIVVTVRALPDEGNRGFLLAFDGPISGSTWQQLEGVDDRTTFRFEKLMINLRPGEYTVLAVLRRGTKDIASEARHVIVSGGD